ncbi:MAG: alpha-amylase family glycosyl hydrolase [Chloroflexota bacterium]|nr:alpha-amylase family glycosyl hydrolase [Chloroflexota bacterium]
MTTHLRIHHDNLTGFSQPVALINTPEKAVETLTPSGQDDYGVYFDLPHADHARFFKLADARVPAPPSDAPAAAPPPTPASEPDSLWRALPFIPAPEQPPAPGAGKKAKPKSSAVKQPSAPEPIAEVWTRTWHPLILTTAPLSIDPRPAAEVAHATDFRPGTYISLTGGRFALGANLLSGDNGALFSLFHPHATAVYVVGTFNDWQYPHHETPDPAKFIPMTLHRGYFDQPNIWLAQVPGIQAGAEYQFCVCTDALIEGQVWTHRLTTDPYARRFGNDYSANNSVVVDPSGFAWDEGDYNTPAIHDLILYELHVHGFTWGHADVPEGLRGTFAGVRHRIEAGYFGKVGVTALSILPLAESPTPQGEHSMGYNSSTFMALERDFGTPDELRAFVAHAHRAGLAVIADQVFNHSANEFNPLWKLILDHPDELGRGEEGGLYYSGASPWGNRIATEREEVQNMLIDACKQWMVEYHVDGFRFDYTHSSTMHHDFLNRLANELQAFKPDVILIAENMPNEQDLNRQGFDGFGQWCNAFHDRIKALLREGEFEGEHSKPEILGDMFYFSKSDFAAHTNNVVNYCESHDEHSVAHEVSSNPALNHPAGKERKARLGLFATMVALGQPMMWMGQEFGVDRERNTVTFAFPEKPDEHGFFAWASRLIRLRRRYPGLRLHGYDPIADGLFKWIVGEWMDEKHGKDKRVVGWLACADKDPKNMILVLMNFENHPVTVDVDAGIPGVWVRLASIDAVNDLAPEGTNTPDHVHSLRMEGTTMHNFVIPDSSGFMYKYVG